MHTHVGSRAVLPAAIFASTLLVLSLLGPDARSFGQTAVCDRACLLQTMKAFLASMSHGRPQEVPLADSAEVRQNTKLVTLGATEWQDVKEVRSTTVAADPITGNVVSRAGVQLRDGKPAYLSTRLKVGPGGRIVDVEISADTTQQVTPAYVWKLDSLFEEVLPPAQRLSRDELEALGRRYFSSLSTHVAVAADFDPTCNRFHSGMQITNVKNTSSDEGAGPPLTCVTTLEGDRPWGLGNEQRFSVVDPERGVLVGYLLLHYPKDPDHTIMYVSEMFKVVNRRIVRIDNVGLVLVGVQSLGFTH